MAPRTYVRLSVHTTSAAQLKSIEERVSAALPGALITGVHRYEDDLTRLEPATTTTTIHHFTSMVRVPGMSAAAVRTSLEAMASTLGVTVSAVLTKPGDPGEYVSYHGKGVWRLEDLDEEESAPK
jgi:hypothetical protein